MARSVRCKNKTFGEIKSSNFINSKRWVRGRFNWQERFGAFSYSHSQPGGKVYSKSGKASRAKIIQTAIPDIAGEVSYRFRRQICFQIDRRSINLTSQISIDSFQKEREARQPPRENGKKGSSLYIVVMKD
jgi:hypothetical protein